MKTNFPPNASQITASCILSNFPFLFCFRVSSSKDGVVDHYRIMGMNGRLSVDEEEFFDSLDDLIKVFAPVSVEMLH
jgi:hypothetical protein